VAASFPFIQQATAVGGSGPAYTLSFASPVGQGHILVAYYAACSHDAAPWSLPTLSDNLHNVWTPPASTATPYAGISYRRNGGGPFAAPVVSAALYAALNVAAGPTTITFAGESPVPVSPSPSLIVAEYGAPASYKAFAWNCFSNLNPYVTEGAYLRLGGGPVGGNRGTAVSISISQTFHQTQAGQPQYGCGIVLLNEFSDALFVLANYSGGGDYNGTVDSWSSDANIRATTVEDPTGRLGFGYAILCDQVGTYAQACGAVKPIGGGATTYIDTAAACNFCA
jgi:hypothetical protein